MRGQQLCQVVAQATKSYSSLVTTKNNTWRLRNWSEYNRSLQERGSLNLWIDARVIADWKHSAKSGKRGASKTYSDTAIQACLCLGLMMRLPLRQCCGLVRSILALMGVDLPCPDYTTLSRRRAALQPDLAPHPSQEPRFVLLDSTGLKVFGEGEWKVRKHGVGKRRTWRKMHLCIDADTQDILACQVTEADAADGPRLAELLEATPGKVKTLAADGAYDSWSNDEHLSKLGIRALIPPCQGSKIRQKKQPGVEPLPRDERLRAIRGFGGGDFLYGRRRWGKESGYTRRSLAETAMMRQKRILGDALRSRSEAGQRVEGLLRCRVLNRLTRLGMPQSYRYQPQAAAG